jgi:hypothetical protein
MVVWTPVTNYRLVEGLGREGDCFPEVLELTLREVRARKDVSMCWTFPGRGFFLCTEGLRAAQRGGDREPLEKASAYNCAFSPEQERDVQFFGREALSGCLARVRSWGGSLEIAIPGDLSLPLGVVLVSPINSVGSLPNEGLLV